MWSIRARLHEGKSNINFWQIAGKSAEFILQLFSEIAKNTKKAHVIPSDCYSNSKARSWPKFNFPSYGIKAETKRFPLSYNLSKTLGKEPNPQVCCDLPDCNNNHYGSNFVRLACYHTFHVPCLSSDGCCSICKEPLEQLIKNKVSQFNEGLLKNGGTELDGESSDPETEDDTATVVNSETGNANAEQYSTSGLWEQ